MNQSILLRICIRENVCFNLIEPIGVQDESKTVGKILYHFNIIDIDHPRYGSTVAYMINSN